MKLQTLQIFQILLRHVQDHGRLCWCGVGVDCRVLCLCTCCCVVVCVVCRVLCVYMWCCVLCWCCCWWWWWCVCGVVVVVCVCVARLGARKNPRAQVQHASVCRFKTPPCVPAKRPHVFNMLAFCRYTRRRFESTHGSVLDLSTVGASLLSFSLLTVISLSFLRCLPRPSFSSFVFFLSFSFSLTLSLSFSFAFSSLFSSLLFSSLLFSLLFSLPFSSLLFPLPSSLFSFRHQTL